MKKSLILSFLFLTLNISAIEVCGVPFGSSYQTTYNAVSSKWGKPYGMNYEEIVYMDKLYAGEYWDIIIFRFQGNGGSSNIFNSCLFGKQFNSLADAERFRDYLANELSKTYKVFGSRTDERGIKSYLGGQDPTNPKLSAWTLDIDRNRVRLIYGPFNYLNEKF